MCLNNMAKKGLYFIKFLLCLSVLHCSEARPTGSNDNKVKMAGEPTHFQVDDKAAELEINANAMGVKVNAKPASLQVVSKPGAPAIPVARPAVYVPPAPASSYYPAPFYPAPFYPSATVVGRRRTVRRRHHFFDMNPSMGNWNFKKEDIPEKVTPKISTKVEHGKRISKKSEITKSPKISQKTEKNHRKRQWIQQVPVLAQMIPYNPVANIRVHPLVQRLLAVSQAAMRNSVPRPMYGLNQQTFSPWRQRFSYISPGYPLGMGQVGPEARNSIHRAIFLPALPGYQSMQAMSPLMATFRPSWSNPSILRAPVSGFNGYYDPILTRDFIPDFNTPALPRVQVPTARTLIPNGIPGGLMYPGYTPLGQLQILSKRLTIPHSSSSAKHNEAKTNSRKTEINTQDKTTSEKNTLEKNTQKKNGKRSAEGSGENKVAHDSSHHSNKNAKRQFILTQPEVQPVQQPIVAYVPVVTNPSLHAPAMTSPTGGNFILNLPERTPGTFMVNVPSSPQTLPMYTPTTGDLNLGHLFNSGQDNVLPEYQPNYVAMATQRSGITTQAFRRGYGVPQVTYRVPLGELTGIMGSPIVRHGPHLTMFYNDPLPSHVQDQIFRNTPLQSRAKIPGRSSLHRHLLDEEDEDQTDNPSDSEDTYDDSPNSERIEDNGSYTERVLPDGRTVFRKDHVGFGPITVEANTAESASRHRDDAIDMDLDSDKRKQIPRPENERRRLEIPTPATP